MIIELPDLKILSLEDIAKLFVMKLVFLGHMNFVVGTKGPLVCCAYVLDCRLCVTDLKMSCDQVFPEALNVSSHVVLRPQQIPEVAISVVESC